MEKEKMHERISLRVARSRYWTVRTTYRLPTEQEEPVCPSAYNGVDNLMSKFLSYYYLFRAKVALSPKSKFKWRVLKFCNDVNDYMSKICNKYAPENQ